MPSTQFRHPALTAGIRLAIALLATLLASVPPSAATSLHQFDLDGLVAASSEIVVGRVTGLSSRWDSAHSMIVTEVHVAVAEQLKGGSPRELVVYQLGGTVGNETVEVDGAASFGDPNEEGVLFLCRDRAGHAMLTGLGQGKFDIERDARSGAVHVQRLQAGFAARDARSLRPVRDGEAAPRFELGEFLGLVRDAVRRGGAR